LNISQIAAMINNPETSAGLIKMVSSKKPKKQTKIKAEIYDLRGIRSFATKIYLMSNASMNINAILKKAHTTGKSRISLNNKLYRGEAMTGGCIGKDKVKTLNQSKNVITTKIAIVRKLLEMYIFLSIYS
jgi:hypothetical protein